MAGKDDKLVLELEQIFSYDSATFLYKMIKIANVRHSEKEYTKTTKK